MLVLNARFIVLAACSRSAGEMAVRRRTLQSAEKKKEEKTKVRKYPAWEVETEIERGEWGKRGVRVRKKENRRMHRTARMMFVGPELEIYGADR